MSDTSNTSTETTDTTDTGATTSQEDEPKTFDKAYVDKLRAEAAKYRTDARSNADAAVKLAAIEEANKTEAQKTADALAAAQRDAADARREALRFKIASKFAIGDEDAELFLTGDDEASLTRQAERLQARDGERKKNGNHVSREGNNNTNVDNDERAFARQLFGGTT